MDKDYEGWHRLKAELHAQHRAPTFQQREIWWCSVGVNVGYEVDGKNRHYNRPVLIVRKYNNRFFMGVPLTTQCKDTPYHFPLHFQEREIRVLLSQARPFDGKRLTHKMGKLPEPEFHAVRRALKKLI